MEHARLVRTDTQSQTKDRIISRGKLATSNADQVRKVRRILEDQGHEIATPEEARAMLGLKGGDRVAF